ncbi:hypothetical protein VNI00_012705 [Paramarasmius palmivorus]|uniref:Uncharacterized protein n=1 Tax=Paramarasmius palmivorus TaxID=297713 RepID=A0AAW0C2H4_9AGAR
MAATILKEIQSKHQTVNNLPRKTINSASTPSITERSRARKSGVQDAFIDEASFTLGASGDQDMRKLLNDGYIRLEQKSQEVPGRLALIFATGVEGSVDKVDPFSDIATRKKQAREEVDAPTTPSTLPARSVISTPNIWHFDTPEFTLLPLSNTRRRRRYMIGCCTVFGPSSTSTYDYLLESLFLRFFIPRYGIERRLARKRGMKTRTPTRGPEPNPDNDSDREYQEAEPDSGRRTTVDGKPQDPFLSYVIHYPKLLKHPGARPRRHRIQTLARPAPPPTEITQQKDLNRAEIR